MFNSFLRQVQTSLIQQETRHDLIYFVSAFEFHFSGCTLIAIFPYTHARTQQEDILANTYTPEPQHM